MLTYVCGLLGTFSRWFLMYESHVATILVPCNMRMRTVAISNTFKVAYAHDPSLSLEFGHGLPAPSSVAFWA